MASPVRRSRCGSLPGLLSAWASRSARPRLTAIARDHLNARWKHGSRQSFENSTSRPAGMHVFPFAVFRSGQHWRLRSSGIARPLKPLFSCRLRSPTTDGQYHGTDSCWGRLITRPCAEGGEIAKGSHSDSGTRRCEQKLLGQCRRTRSARLALPPFPCRRSTKRRGWPGACGLCPRYKERLPDLHAIDDETANPNNVRFVSSHIGSAFLRSIYLDDSYHMITSDRRVPTAATA
jgi:hypothetical protein